VFTLALLAFLGVPQDAAAQIQDSFNDTIYVDTVEVPDGGYDFGDTVWVGLGVSNTFDVGGMSYRIEIPDTSRIRPYWVEDLQSGSYPVALRLVGRGLAFDKTEAVTTAVVKHPDTANIITGLLVDFAGTASLPQGTGVVLEIGFLAKAGIVKGDSARVVVDDDLTQPIEPRNNLSDVTGTLAVYPRLRPGLVKFGEEGTGPGPGNDPPIITFAPDQVAYTIKQGQTVTFDVTATDPDTTNDIVTLSAGIPAGATFSPANPITDTVTVVGTFAWTPNFSQEGIFNAVFSAADNLGASGSRTVVITVEKQDIDILFTGSADNAQPRGGIPGKTGVLMPVDVLASRDIYGIQFDLILDGSVYRVDSIVATPKLDNFTLWDNVGLNRDTIRVITFSVSGDSIPLDGNTTILEVALTVDTGAVSGRYPVSFINALEAITPDPETPSVEMVVQNGVLFVDAFGDVNLDFSLDVADMVGLTASILGRAVLTERQIDVADVNGDGSANVIDLVAIVNAVLGFDTLRVPARPVYDGGEAELQLVYGGLAGDQALYYVEGSMPTDVAGMELTFTYDFDRLEPYVPTRTGQASGLNVQSVRDNGQMKIVAYYNADPQAAVPPGHGRYFVLPVKVKEPWADMARPPLSLDAAVVSDVSAAKVRVKGMDGSDPVLPAAFVLHQNYPNPFNPATTIQFDIGGAAGDMVALDIYNVLGQHVKELTRAEMAAGSYEIVWDGTDRFGQRVATGVYLYRLRVGTEVQTKKMLLLK
jgi:hypothetical protein